MHAMILAINYNCKVIPFIFSDKLKSFKEEITNSFCLEEVQNHIYKNLNSIIGK